MSHNDLTTIAVCADLLSAARIRGTAEQAGASVEVLTRGDVLDRVRTLRPGRVLLDLDARWCDGVRLIEALKADPELASIPVVAYVSHVREAAIEAARSAGADEVLPRGAFVKRLREYL